VTGDLERDLTFEDKNNGAANDRDGIDATGMDVGKR
jgi:hypothetical protein